MDLQVHALAGGDLMDAPSIDILGERLSFGAWDNGVWVILVLLLIIGFVHTQSWRRRRMRQLWSRGPLPRLIDARDRYLLRGVMIVGASALLVVALMRPQLGTRETEAKNMGIDIAIALDASKSMRVTDVMPDRLKAANLEVGRLLDTLAGGRVALVPFAGLAFVQTPLTSDFQVVKTYLDDLRVEDMPRGGTAIGFAVHEALRALLPPEALEGTSAELGSGTQGGRSDAAEGARAPGVQPFEGSKHKAIILFTDGEDHETNPLEAAKLCKKLGVTLFTVGVGTAQGRPIPLVNDEGEEVGVVKGPDGKHMFSELNEALLHDMADVTGGSYFHLSAKGLGDGLLAAIDQLEKKEFEATFKQLGADRYQWVLIPALLLLLAEAWWATRRRPLAALYAARRRREARGSANKSVIPGRRRRVA